MKYSKDEIMQYLLEEDVKFIRLAFCDVFGKRKNISVMPEDRGENARREVCLTLEQMGLRPESSHHEMGPGQNEIDFRYADALTAAVRE